MISMFNVQCTCIFNNTHIKIISVALLDTLHSESESLPQVSKREALVSEL